MQIEPTQGFSNRLGNDVWLQNFRAQIQFWSYDCNVAQRQSLLGLHKNGAAADLNSVLRSTHHGCTNALHGFAQFNVRPLREHQALDLTSEVSPQVIETGRLSVIEVF